MRHPPCAGHQHDGNFQHFDVARQARLIKFIRQLPGSRGKKYERQNEQSGNQLIQYPDIGRGPVDGVIGQDGQQGRLEYIVIEGTQKFGPKEWPEPTLAQQLELTRFARLAHVDVKNGFECRQV